MVVLKRPSLFKILARCFMIKGPGQVSAEFEVGSRQKICFAAKLVFRTSERIPGIPTSPNAPRVTRWRSTARRHGARSYAPHFTVTLRPHRGVLSSGSGFLQYCSIRITWSHCDAQMTPRDAISDELTLELTLELILWKLASMNRTLGLLEWFFLTQKCCSRWKWKLHCGLRWRYFYNCKMAYALHKDWEWGGAAQHNG